MKIKKILTSFLAGAIILAAIPLMARGYGKGYMGGRNSTYTQPAGDQAYRGYGDGTMPRPMDGTGFGAQNNDFRGKGQGKRLRDGSCVNSTTQ